MSEEPAPSWVPTFPAIRRVDALWCRAERMIAAAMFVAMGLMVFASVLTEAFGRRREWWHVAMLFGAVLLAVRTRTVRAGERRLDFGMSLAVAAAITAGLAAVVYLYVTRYPGGFIWAQKLAIVLMIWIAMLGSSIATYDRSHLALEMGEKLWPERVLHIIKAVAHAVSTAFCVGAFLVAGEIVLHMRDEGTPSSTATEWLPTWVAYIVVPYAFASMAVRFLAQAYTTASRTAEPIEERLPS